MIYENYCSFILITVRKGLINKIKILKKFNILDMNFVFYKSTNSFNHMFTQEFTSKNLKNGLGNIPVE